MVLRRLRIEGCVVYDRGVVGGINHKSTFDGRSMFEPSIDRRFSDLKRLATLGHTPASTYKDGNSKDNYL